jgi:hypothetical protein
VAVVGPAVALAIAVAFDVPTPVFLLVGLAIAFALSVYSSRRGTADQPGPADGAGGRGSISTSFVDGVPQAVPGG